MARLKIFLLILVLVSGNNLLHAQSEGRALIDSLLRRLPLQQEDTNKVKVLNRLSRTFYTINPDSGIIFGKEGLQLATKLAWKKGLVFANNALGVNFSARNDFDAALDHYLKSLRLSEETGDRRATVGVTRNIVSIYLDRGEYAKALEMNLKALKIAEELADKQEIAYGTCNIANIYYCMSDFPKTLEFAFRSLKVDEEIGDKQGVSRVTVVIGTVYMAQRDYAKAREYFLKSLKISEETDTKEGIIAATGNIGISYIQEENYPTALRYLFRALHVSEEVGDAPSIAQNTLSIGGAYAAMGDNANALAYEFAALKKEEELGARPNVCFSLGIIGGIYLSLARDGNKHPVYASQEILHGPYAGKEIPKSKGELLRLAISFLKRAVDSAGPLGVMEVLQESNQHLADAYQLAGQHDKALDAYRDYIKIRDSIFSHENGRKMVQQQMKYDFEKREDSIKLVNADKEKAAALRYLRQRSYTWMGLGGILALAAFSFFMFRNNKLLAKEKERSESLLLNILPAEVAGELKDKGSAKARHFENVTVLFTDFANFTEAGARMSPETLIDELHECFKKFDEITHKYNIEKIKTIGDAYLAVCGLPVPDAQHAEKVVQAAVEINAFMEDRLAKLGNDRTFAIRLGIHSGNVVAGIVGVRKFAYDIWGDTVNTAARMEHHGKAGRINISQTTYELVKEKFSCEYRGEIDAKGKGMMKMYFIS